MTAFPDPATLARRLAAARPIEQRLPAEVGFYLLSYLQLALRHPEARWGRAAVIVTGAALDLQMALVERVPEAAALLQAGWDPAQDDRS